MYKKASYGSFGNHHSAFPDLHIQSLGSNVYRCHCVESPYVQIQLHKLLTGCTENTELLMNLIQTLKYLVIVMIIFLEI